VNSKHDDYLISIGFQTPLIEWAHEVIEFCQLVLSESMSQGEFDIFVSEHVDGGGRRTYESLWIFTPRFCLDAGNLSASPRFRYFVLRYSTSWELNRNKFDGKATTADSRMTVQIEGSGDDLMLRASGDNCMKLLDVFKRYIVPNTGKAVETTIIDES
jgi:hypothetical protein